MKNLLYTIALSLIAFPNVFAADLNVEIGNKKEAISTIICAIFEGKEGFPMDNKKALITVKGSVNGDEKTICSFFGLARKKYAVSVMQDLNGNEKVDTSLVGFPKEPWGVSNNAPAHSFGPPRFNEAEFLLEENTIIKINLVQP